MDAIVILSSIIVLSSVHCLEEDSSVLIVNLTSSNFLKLRQSQIHPIVREDRIKFILYTRAQNVNQNTDSSNLLFIFSDLESLGKANPNAELKVLLFNFRNQHTVQTNSNNGSNLKYPHGYRLIRNNYKNLRSSGFNSSHQTKVIIHGYINNYTSAAIQLPKNAYLSNGKYNVLAVDWSEYAFPYVLAATSAKPVGYLTGLMVSYLMDGGNLQSSDLHFIGHSLGAHVAGYAVERIRSKPARITGLDPAAPIFSENPPSERLGEEDAEFVDVIHTSVRVLGMAQNIGHADFYPAGGKHQPRCSSDIVEEVIGSCDHGQSYIYFAESIRNKNLFPAVKCRSLSDALDKKCKGRKTAMMGDSAIYKKPRGIYYVDVRTLEQSFKILDYFPVFSHPWPPRGGCNLLHIWLDPDLTLRDDLQNGPIKNFLKYLEAAYINLSMVIFWVLQGLSGWVGTHKEGLMRT